MKYNLLIATLFSLLLMNPSLASSEDKFSDWTNDFAEDLYDKAGNLVFSGKEKFYDKSGNMINNVRDYTGNMYDKAGNMIEMVRYKVQDHAEELNDKVEEKTGMNLKEPRWTIRKVYDEAGNAVENARDYAEDLYDKAGKMISNAKDSMLDAGKNALYTAEDTAEAVYDRAGNVIEDTKDYAEEIYDKAGNLAQNAKETFYDKAGNVVHNIREYTGFLYNKAGNLVEFGRNSSARARDAIKEKAGHAKEYVDEKLEGQDTLNKKASKFFQKAKDSLSFFIKVDSFIDKLFGNIFKLILTLVSVILSGYLVIFFSNKGNREKSKHRVKGLAYAGKSGVGKAKKRLAKTTSRMKASHENNDGYHNMDYGDGTYANKDQ